MEFTAPQTGRYHFTAGHEPHLESDCTDECRAGAPDFVAEPGPVVTIKFDNSESRFTPSGGEPFYPES